MAIIDNLQKISDTVWELPSSYKEGMRVPARIIAMEKLVCEMDEAVYQQISNVATLPGITRYALCMPDGHSGYGFPIGGVAAMRCGFRIARIRGRSTCSRGSASVAGRYDDAGC